MIERNKETLSRMIGTVLATSLLVFAPACSEAEQAGHDEGAAEHSDHDDHGDGTDGHDEHSDVVELSAAQIEAAGIRVEVATGGRIARHMTLPAVITANADAVTHINPKAPGIVRSIHKHLGESVAVGELLCVIDSIELGRSVAEFVRAEALVDAARITLERERALYEDRLAATTQVLKGAVEVNQRIYEREQELHEKGVSTIRPMLEAERALRSSQLEKERQLTDLRSERDARLLALEVSLIERRIGLDAGRSVLLALGVDPNLLADAETALPLLAGSYEIRAPREGIVAGRHITAGEWVDGETKLYTLEDLSYVWVLASAFEKQIQSVRTGQPAQIRIDAFPGDDFAGEVSLVGYQVDAESRALGVRIALENKTLENWPEQHPLRPGMFGSVDLVVDSYSARIVIPESAIVHEADGEYVFVQTAPDDFERRRVEIGPPSGAVVEVLSGVEPGEQVAVSGTFRLKSAFGAGELGGGHSH